MCNNGFGYDPIFYLAEEKCTSAQLSSKRKNQLSHRMQALSRLKEYQTRLMDYLRGAELIIHNVPFDVGFLDAELARVSAKAFKIADVCSVHDTLPQARKMFKGEANNLNALCQRFKIDTSQRKLHGALIDAELLADVYLAMTGEL